MIDIILPGYSDKNKAWLETVARELKTNNELRTIYWNHWSDIHKKFDAKEKSIDTLDVMLDDFANVVAKSIGTLVASYMIVSAPEKIKKAVFCGIPLTDLTETDLEVYKKALQIIDPENIICIQNSNDPHGSFDEVSKFVRSVNPRVKIISKDADNHEYPYVSDFFDFLDEKNREPKSIL